MRWFIRSSLRRPRPSLETQLVGAQIMLRMADCEDWNTWRVLRDMSRDFLIPWEPKWPSNAMTYGFFCGLLRRQWRDWRAGKAFAFAVFMHADSDAGNGRPVLIGGITLGDVVYVDNPRASIGYWIGRPYAGQGLMTEAVGLVCDFAFNNLNLNTVAAACLPHNEPSKALLRRTGFVEIGFAKDYLQINGKKEDHLLWEKHSDRKHMAQ